MEKKEIEIFKRSEIAEKAEIDPMYYSYPRCLEMWTRTLLSIDDISGMSGVPVGILREWIEKYEWKRGKIEDIKKLERNTAECLQKYSPNISEQIKGVGDILLRESMKILEGGSGGDLKASERISFALKFKELEARLRGQIKLPSVSIQLNQNNVYRDWIERGERMFGDGVEIEEYQSNSVGSAIPAEILERIPEQKSRYMELSEEEMEEYLR